MEIKQIKKDNEKLDTEDLIEVITIEPLLRVEVSIKRYTKEKGKEPTIEEIARLNVDLLELETNFIKEKEKNSKLKDKEIIEILMSLL